MGQEPEQDGREIRLPPVVYVEDIMLEIFPDDYNYLETDAWLTDKGYKEVSEFPDFRVKWPEELLGIVLGKSFHADHKKILHGLGLRTIHMDLFKAIMKDIGFSHKETRYVFYREE